MAAQKDADNDAGEDARNGDGRQARQAPGGDFDAWLGALLTGGPGDDRDSRLWACGETEVTWARMRAETAHAREMLAAHGIGAGGTVAVQLPPSFTLLWSVFALWSAGAQVMLLDPRLTQAETTRLLDLCEPRHHLTSGSAGGPAAAFRDECEVVVRPRPSGRPAHTGHRLLQFSSGSTGLPKVIGRTGSSLLAEVERFAAVPGMPGPGESVLLLSSLTHSFGLVGGVLHALDRGVALHFAARPQPAELLRTMAERAPAAIFGVPVHFDLLSRVAAVPSLPSLRLAVSGGEALASEVFDRFESRFGIRVGQAYGMTETGIIATDLAGEHRPPAVGRPAPGVETTVVDGTLRIRLPETPYLHTDRAERFGDGWLNTYDRCAVRPGSGVLEVHGRADSMVAIGGLKVDLGEVESALLRHPAVTEAVVIFGEAIEAHVRVTGAVPKAVLLDWCREQLSPHKIPKSFHFSSTALPRTSNGKLLRNRELLHAARGQGRPVGVR